MNLVLRVPIFTWRPQCYLCHVVFLALSQVSLLHGRGTTIQTPLICERQHSLVNHLAKVPLSPLSSGVTASITTTEFLCSGVGVYYHLCYRKGCGKIDCGPQNDAEKLAH